MKPKLTSQEFEAIEVTMVLEFAATAPPEILQQMAMQWNGSHAFLEWLVDRPETDKATASLVYWMSGPRFWKQYINREELLKKDKSTKTFDFVERLEEKLISGFYLNQQIAFDLTQDDAGTVWADEYLNEKSLRDIPIALFSSLKGEHVEHPENFEEGKPPVLAKKTDEMYKQYDIVD